MCSFSSSFLLLIVSASNPIQRVNYLQLLCLIFIVNIAWIKSHLESELYAALLFDFHCWQCLLETLSRKWVVFSFFALFPLLTLPAWNLVQRVSYVQLLCLISMANIASNPIQTVCYMQAALLDIYFWKFLYKILSRLWVLCSSFAWFLLLTLLIWPPIQVVSHVQLLCFIFIPDITHLNFYPESGFYAAFFLDFHYWHCLDEIPSREWAICSFSF